MRPVRRVGAGLTALAMAMLLLLGLTASADVGDTIRVSVNSAGVEGNNNSFGSSVSADGRYVASHSFATNLVAGDTNNASDVFVHDTSTGDTIRVSVNSAATEGNDNSFDPSVSADGRYVAFQSSASNLVAGDTNNLSDVFVHDTSSGDTTRVSVDSAGVEGNEDSSWASVSADGRYVAFQSSASNLVAGDTNNASDVFVHDTSSGVTTRVSVDSAGVEGDTGSSSPSVSADGRYVVFESAASNLVAGDTNSASDVFVHDTSSGVTTRVSINSAGVEGNGSSLEPSVSTDGRYVAFHSLASNLVAGDTNDRADVFVHDTSSDATTRVSVNGAGVEGNTTSSGASVSADGRYVAFASVASNLVAGDTNGVSDVFVHDTTSGDTIRVSVHTDGVEGNNTSSGASVSADGRYVAFDSFASNLVAGDTNFRADVFVHQALADPPPPTTTTTTTTTPDGDRDFFTDDDDSIFEDDINAIAEAGITRGCNPPENDHYCPDDSFLRGQAAAFVRRALGVPATSTDHFVDDDGNIFEEDINAIAEEGITRGCNPPDNTMFCPTDPFTRGQAAAFMRRALNVPATGTDHFVDDDGNIFEEDINAIAEAGITRGCNPPENDRYCPSDPFTRGQAAAFMRRALLP